MIVDFPSWIEQLECLIVLLILSILLLNNCSSHREVGSSRAQQAGIEEENIREAVFRYQFREYERLQAPVSVYCLKLNDDDDPSNELILRFRNYKPTVKKRSGCSFVEQVGPKDSPDPVGYVIDTVSGKPGVQFEIHRIKWMNDREAIVVGGFYKMSLNASTDEYYLIKRYGKWMVTRTKNVAVS